MAGLDAARASAGRPPRRRGSSIPAGLSISRTPSIAPAPRRRRGGAQATVAAALAVRGAGAAARRSPRAGTPTSSSGSSVGGEAGGAAVSAAALGAGDDRDVDVVVGGPQRDFVLALALAAGELAHEHRDLRPLQRPQLVDDALGVALLGLGAVEVLGAQRDERELAVVVALRPAPSASAEQRELARSACPRTGAGRRRARRRPLRSARRPSGARAGRCSRT